MSGGNGFGWGSKGGGGALATGILQLQGGVPLDTTLRNVADQAGTLSPLQLSTTQVGIATNGATPTSTATQRGSFDFVFSGLSWNGSAAIDAIWKIKQSADLTQDNFPRIVGDYNGVQFIRIDKSTNLTTYNYIGNTCFGYQSGNSLASTGVGAYHNAFYGGHSGQSNTTGYQNTFLGNRAGVQNTTGFQNTFVGQGAGYENITGNYNVGMGFHAGLNMLGDSNVCIGKAAGQAITGSTAQNSVFIGKDSGNLITTGNDNSFVGANSGYSINVGGFNSGLGGGSLFSIKTGADNVSIGYRAGYTNTPANALTTGSQNIFIGRESGFDSATQRTNAIAIGYMAKVDADNTIVLGNTSIVKTILRGTINSGIQNGNAGLSTGDLYYDTAANILANGDAVVGRKA